MLKSMHYFTFCHIIFYVQSMRNIYLFCSKANKKQNKILSLTRLGANSITYEKMTGKAPTDVSLRFNHSKWGVFYVPLLQQLDSHINKFLYHSHVRHKSCKWKIEFKSKIIWTLLKKVSFIYHISKNAFILDD
jgi:hypothetical protein